MVAPRPGGATEPPQIERRAPGATAARCPPLTETADSHVSRLLALVMIGKDEALSIREALASARPPSIASRASTPAPTSGTQALDREAMAGVPGELLEEPFADFGATRSRALDLVAGDAALRAVLERRPGDARLLQNLAFTTGARHR